MSEPPPRSNASGDVEIEVCDPGGRLPPSASAWVRERLLAASKHLGLTGQVLVRLVGDDEMAAAHVQHSGVSGTTDVLTFDLRENPGSERMTMDVEVLACVDEAARQTAARGHAVEREVLLYAVHGLLHCLGEDDHDEASAARMHAREDAILEAIGVGVTFAAGVSARSAGEEGR